MIQIPNGKKIRVILDTDAKCEADDAFAIVHALLTPKFDMQGIIAAHYSPDSQPETMESSYQECVHLLSLMSLPKIPTVYKGHGSPLPESLLLTDHAACPPLSDGARFIIEEAMREDERPLYIAFQGPLTDVASAYLHEPAIAKRLTLIWIGGAPYPHGGWEFNLMNDRVAAQAIMNSDIELWQVPMDVYCRVTVSLTELYTKVRPYGAIGAYLYDQLDTLNKELGHRDSWVFGETWNLGDSPVVTLMMYPQFHFSTLREAPSILEDGSYTFDGTGRNIRVYHDIDSRLILEDFYAKLMLHAEG